MSNQISSSSSNPNCNYYYNSGAYQQAVNGLIGGLVTFFILWILNMVAIGIVTRRRGLNPAVYVALAFFCGFTAWACVACSQPQQQVIVVTNGAPMGQMAPNSYPAPNPYGQQPAPNPYGQPAPNPYGQQPAPNPYGQPAPNPYGQPAPNPYGQPSDAPNPYGGDLVKPQ